MKIVPSLSNLVVLFFFFFADLTNDPDTEIGSFIAGNTLGLSTGKIQPRDKEILKIVYQQKTGKPPLHLCLR